MSRLEWIAVAWGGLFAGVGLVVLADEPGPIRVTVAVVLFAVAGFLAGVRAESNRILHAILGAIAGLVFYEVFVGLTWIVDLMGGTDRARFVFSHDGAWWHLVLCVVAAFLGGAFAAYRLRRLDEPRLGRRGA